MDENTTPAPDYSTQKREFAKLLLRHPHKAHDHAFMVFPNAADTYRALEAADSWPADPEVKRIMTEIAAQVGPDAYLLSKEEAAREVLTIAQDDKVEMKPRLEAYKLYGELMGHLGKANTNVNVGVAGAVEDLMSRIEKQGRPKPRGAQQP